MSYNAISFSPILTNNLFSERLNQIDKIFSKLTGEQIASNLPDYNFIKNANNQYELILSVPGYQEDKLDISIQNNELTVSTTETNNTEINEDKKYLYKGIKDGRFSISFNLHNPIKIKKAVLKLGLLKITFEYEIPEEQKIKKISIEK
ncbi:Hsp20 family protein [Buchnera aphidicola]|uniref:Hsp20 family protein n=1 Tax=Buchnera aphidicola TaxID=9 RepID=UPI003463EC08